MERRNEYRPLNEMRICNNCEKLRPIKDYYRGGGKRIGTCRFCIGEAHHKKYFSPEEVAKRVREKEIRKQRRADLKSGKELIDVLRTD